MKQTSVVASFLLLFLVACHDHDQQNGKTENDVDAARSFIQAALEGDFQKASSYMLQDSSNLAYLNLTQRNYERLGAEEKRNLREASIRFYSPTVDVNDSTRIFIYSNSYKNDKDTLRVIRKDSAWLADLKYIFEHDRDTTSTVQELNPLPGTLPAKISPAVKTSAKHKTDTVRMSPKNPYMDTTRQ
jgi:hypothetical protein